MHRVSLSAYLRSESAPAITVETNLPRPQWILIQRSTPVVHSELRSRSLATNPATLLTVSSSDYDDEQGGVQRAQILFQEPTKRNSKRNTATLTLRSNSKQPYSICSSSDTDVNLYFRLHLSSLASLLSLLFFLLLPPALHSSTAPDETTLAPRH